MAYDSDDNLLALVPSGSTTSEEGKHASDTRRTTVMPQRYELRQSCRKTRRTYYPHRETRASVASPYNSRKRKQRMPCRSSSPQQKRHKSLKRESPIAENCHPPARPINFDEDYDDGTSTTTQKPILNAAATLQWEGQLYIPSDRCGESLPCAITNPIPVRVPAAAVSQLPGRASRSDEGEWLLGLAIKSYVEPACQQLQYVVLLDDGHELHLPCGDVHHILVTPLTTDEHAQQQQSMTMQTHLQGHPSSVDIDDTDFFSEDIVSDNEGDCTLQRHRTSLRCSEGRLQASDNDHQLFSTPEPSLSEFNELFSPSCFLQSNDLHNRFANSALATLPNDFLLSKEEGHVLPVTPTAAKETTAEPSFSDLFHGVFLDQVTAFSMTMSPVAAGTPTLAATPAQGIALDSSLGFLQDAAVQLRSKSVAGSALAGTSPDQLMSPALGFAEGAKLKQIARRSNRPLLPPLSGNNGMVHQSSASKAPVHAPSLTTQPVNATASYRKRFPPDFGAGLPGIASATEDMRDRPHIVAAQDLRATAEEALTNEPQMRRAARPPRGQARGVSAAAQARAFAAAFAEDTWTTTHSTFAHDPVTFSGPTAGPNFPFQRMPTKLSLFGRFWSDRMLSTICDETNRYASEVDSETKLPMGGPFWWGLTPMELRAFFGVSLLMGIKRLPNHRAYWSKEYPFLQCGLIASTMSKSRYEDITRCLHVSNDRSNERGGWRTSAQKLAKLDWLIEEIRTRCKASWNLHQELTVDECMIRYKGSYCPIRQYIPKKPTKWGIKVWALADARTKYIYDFDVYTGAVHRNSVSASEEGGAKSAYEAVMLLMRGLHGRSHVVGTDCFFTSVKLVVDLAALGTYSTGTVMTNRVGLPKVLAQRQNFAGQSQGTIAWRMHGSRKVCCVVWVDRKPVLLLSSFFSPLPRLGQEWPTVPRRVAGEEIDVVTSPVHKGYTEFMRGVDVADQMRGAYSSQVRSHKWWHRIFFFLLDTSVVNSYLLYKAICERLMQDPIPRLDFHLLLADSLCKPWIVKRGCVSRFRLATPAVHCLVRTNSRKKCRSCLGRRRTNLCCLQCGGVHLHMGECFMRTHYPLRR